ncbi:MAG TPA: hypothetical protein VNZ52_13805 [Candidatus Thermoplasmatota archaeon]|nr:hypothetical protein [Candidatus Thermoplasmatota archaeon]
MPRGDAAAPLDKPTPKKAKGPALRAPDLRFVEELRVWDPVLSRRSIETTYRFTMRTGEVHEFDLAYKYDLPVIEETWRLRNLARLLVSLPALNYGLFTERFVLDYPLTRADVAYLKEMMDVTAREQYLTRIVSENPLILPEYRITPEEFDPKAVKRVAKVEVDLEKAQAEEAELDADKYAVLSSGGKESLLTYGLLKELGKEVHPIYFNESGRHWHTAVTSYRHMQRTEPLTKRIWSTTDRLYTGVNKILPLVRRDFQRVRADVYPIQMWVFNNYQVAAMPYLLHAGVGNLLMGNEYDEGPWPEVKGVRYYYAIYDQSQEFDLRASAFYGEKGLPVSQFSLVRPIAGPMVQEILGKRYPDLWKTQTSCHATHTKAGKVLPCGRCSKCLGVMLFHLQAGLDPTKIRYTKADVARLPERVATTHLKLDRGEAENSLSKLVERGWPFQGSFNGFEPREHPAVDRLRFDEEMSLLTNLPEHLRANVHRLFLEHAKGALLKRGGKWAPLSREQLLKA